MSRLVYLSFMGVLPEALTIVLQHYLVLVINPARRRAQTRMLVSQHRLAVERLRYEERYQRAVVPQPQSLRWCTCI
ncbi:hypothetical protein FB451DRAFT_1234095 [Mycena latifolia]|nr:hypothetical protein FB451DRAFT_1234095 [Mycena latifolia]